MIIIFECNEDIKQLKELFKEYSSKNTKNLYNSYLIDGSCDISFAIKELVSYCDHKLLMCFDDDYIPKNFLEKN